MYRLVRCMGARYTVTLAVHSDARGGVGVQVMTLNNANGSKQDFIFNKASADMNFSN